MTIIEKQIKLVGSKGEHELAGLFDSGATYSCIDQDLARELEAVIPLPSPLSLETAEEGRTVKVKEAVRLDFHLDGYRFSDEFMVIPGSFASAQDKLSGRLIIGVATMQKWHFKLDFEADEVIIDPRVTRLRLL